MTCIPHLWQLADTNGDDQADQRKSLHYGYGVRVAFRGHDSHGLILGQTGDSISPLVTGVTTLTLKAVSISIRGAEQFSAVNWMVATWKSLPPDSAIPGISV